MIELTVEQLAIYKLHVSAVWHEFYLQGDVPSQVRLGLFFSNSESWASEKSFQPKTKAVIK